MVNKENLYGLYSIPGKSLRTVRRCSGAILKSAIVRDDVMEW